MNDTFLYLMSRVHVFFFVVNSQLLTTAFNGRFSICYTLKVLLTGNLTDIDCGKGSNISNYLYVFILGQMCHAVGGTAIFNNGLTYLDDNVRNKDVPLYVGKLPPSSTMLSPMIISEPKLFTLLPANNCLNHDIIRTKVIYIVTSIFNDVFTNDNIKNKVITLLPASSTWPRS